MMLLAVNRLELYRHTECVILIICPVELMLNFSEVSLNDVAEYTKIPMYERYNLFLNKSWDRLYTISKVR